MALVLQPAPSDTLSSPQLSPSFVPTPSLQVVATTASLTPAVPDSVNTAPTGTNTVSATVSLTAVIQTAAPNPPPRGPPPVLNAQPQIGPIRAGHLCEVCGNRWARKAGLYLHLHERHPEEYKRVTGKPVRRRRPAVVVVDRG